MINLTAKIVAAYLRNNSVTVDELPNLIGIIHAAINNAVRPAVPAPSLQQPAVPVKRSVTPDAVVCLDCGKAQVMLKRHVRSAHDLSVDEYREKWSLPASYPMVAPNYSAIRSKLAHEFGLGRKSASTIPDDPAPAATSAPAGIKYPASRWSKTIE